MSSRKIATMAFVLVMAVSTAFASTPQQSQQDQEKAMEAYMKLAATNENHAYLAKFAGEWNISMTAWMQPGVPPQKSQGTSQAETILGGRFIKMHFKGIMFGQPFEGVQIVGYDNMKKKFITLWIDNTSTAFFLSFEGTLDAASKTMTDTGLWPDPVTGGTVRFKGISKMISPDEYTYEMFMVGADGQEFKSMEYRAVRKK